MNLGHAEPSHKGVSRGRVFEINLGHGERSDKGRTKGNDTNLNSRSDQPELNLGHTERSDKGIKIRE